MENPSLTKRQTQLLKAIIQEFMDTAEAVGSIHLPYKYDLGVSPATIRNEMTMLAKMGLLAKSHVSSGRIPTSAGFKYFVDEILEQLEEIEVEKEAKMREEIFRHRFNVDNLMYAAVHKLVATTRYTAIGLFNDRLYLHGISNLLIHPEFQNLGKFRQLLHAIENTKFLSNIFNRISEHEEELYVLIGKGDIGDDVFESTSLVFGKLNLHKGNKGFIGVLGPNRMDYSRVIPPVKWMVNTINNSVRGW